MTGARQNELERPRRVRLDVVAAQLQRICARRIRTGDGGESDVVTGLAHEGEVHRLVVRLRTLDVRERAYGTTQPLLETQLRECDLARCLVHLEVREGAMRDAVRLDANSRAFQGGELLPLDRAVEDALHSQVFLVRQRMPIVEVADGHEEHRG